MVERLNGETSDEDGEDSDADCNTVNSSVHSTTAVHSDQPRCAYIKCSISSNLALSAF